MIVDVVHRLEADPWLTDLARGFAAEVADPAWILGRQWQLGEHQGEDASSPVGVVYRARLHRHRSGERPAAARPAPRPGRGHRGVRTGGLLDRGAARSARQARRRHRDQRRRTAPRRSTLCWSGLPVPYDVLDGGGPDGRALWRRRAS